MPQKSNKTLYSVHPEFEIVQNWISTLKDKSGRSLDEWIALVRKKGPADEKERRDWLKGEHGLGTNSAWWIAERAGKPGGAVSDDDPEGYLLAAEQWVEDMFSGSKAGLRPIYNRLLEIAFRLGKDVRVCPCKTIVPLYRKHVFAQIKPTTRTRLDLGLALGNTKATGRLIDTGGLAKKDRITHRIPLQALAEID